ncbi:ribosomal protein S6 kinase delta-1 isoform X2 [Tribolium castaneum]|uniref:ribosomal protein S6 kinase delta-1 isoform X2 n=1 Tax=Tribolium castaneum TaxID=7070 RepID=UPI0030FE9AFC
MSKRHNLKSAVRCHFDSRLIASKKCEILSKSQKMVSNGDNWVRIFDIPDISKHRKGFTIYKVISMLYPESCPDAITKITVWKRFNDFKKLHREIKVLHNKLNIKEKFPSLPTSTYFKRFSDETVQERRQSILNFLEYVGYHSQLFTSSEFVKFFETSHTPVDQLNANSDDDRTISDTDSVTTNSDFFADSVPQKTLSKSRLSLSHSHQSKNSDNISISTTTDSITLLDGQIYPTPPNTPSCAENYAQYIIDASIHVNIATELENEKKYEDAFTAYKTAIDILLKYGKDDKNYDRRQIVRYKTDKYLLRAEKIYNMHLAPEVQSLKRITESEENGQNADQYVQRPISDLYKYKVVRVIASGMLVLHSELQQLFYIKVIHKTMKFLNDNLILPENVPYMVKLCNYYNCENALFLVLEYCSGKALWDYVKCRSEDPSDIFYPNEAQILRQVHDMDLSDPESEHSYSDLINDYASNKGKNSTKCDDDDDDYVKVDPGFNRNLMDEPVPSKLPDLLRKSSRKFSEMSSFDDLDLAQSLLIPHENIVKWAAQLLLALEKVHALGVVCHDLQSRNLLIDDEGDLVLTYMCNVNDVFAPESLQNVAPEIFSFEPVTTAADWWCYGAILYELLVGMPLSEIYPEGLTSHTVLKVPKYVSPEGRSLLRQLLTFEPQKRLGFGANGPENLKSHPFFHSVDWEQLLSKYNFKV